MTDLAALVAEVRGALQRMEKARETYETGAHLTKTQQDEIDLWRQRRAAEDAVKHAAPEWLGALVQAVEDQQREIARLGQIAKDYDASLRAMPFASETRAERDRLRAEVAQLRADGQRLTEALDTIYKIAAGGDVRRTAFEALHPSVPPGDAP